MRAKDPKQQKHVRLWRHSEAKGKESTPKVYV